MNTELIEETWESISGHHRELVRDFYGRLFNTYPEYAAYFDEETMQRQMDKMIQNMALMAKLGDNTTAVRPHLEKVGQAHSHMELSGEDFERFSDLLIQVIGEYCQTYGGGWSEDCERAWTEAFQQVIMPHMMSGLQRH